VTLAVASLATDPRGHRRTRSSQNTDPLLDGRSPAIAASNSYGRVCGFRRMRRILRHSGLARGAFAKKCENSVVGQFEKRGGLIGKSGFRI